MAENNNEVAKVAINDIGTEEDFIKAVDSTIKNFDDGDLVEGTVVKIDHDEVLLDFVADVQQYFVVINLYDCTFN